MLICQTHPKANIPLYLFKNGVKPNFTSSGAQKLQGFQSVGFHSVSGECGVSGENCVFLWFSRFWWHPFNPTYDIPKVSLVWIRIHRISGFSGL